MIDSVAVLPWLHIREPIVVGAVTFYPPQLAATRLGDSALLLAERIAIYREKWDESPVQSTIAIHADQLANGGDAVHAELQRATDILMMAAMFNNNGQTNQTNATTFSLVIQKMGGGAGFISDRSRRRNGYVNDGGPATIMIHKPSYAAAFSSFNERIRDALVSADRLPLDNVGRLFDALAWFRRGSTDADNVEPVVDLVLILTAVDFLLAHSGTTRSNMDYERVKQLLTPFEMIPCCSVRKTHSERCHIEAVLFVLDEFRNASLHPRDFGKSAPFAFEKRQENIFTWIADRTFMALLVARLVELGTLPPDKASLTSVEGIEEWIFDPKPSSNLSISAATLRIGLQEGFLQSYCNQVVKVGEEPAPDERRIDWATELFTALGNPPAPWQVVLKWLRNGRAALEMHDGVPASRTLREFTTIEVSGETLSRVAEMIRDWFANHRPFQR